MDGKVVSYGGTFVGIATRLVPLKSAVYPSAGTATLVFFDRLS